MNKTDIVTPPHSPTTRYQATVTIVHGKAMDFVELNEELEAQSNDDIEIINIHDIVEITSNLSRNRQTTRHLVNRHLRCVRCNRPRAGRRWHCRVHEKTCTRCRYLLTHGAFSCCGCILHKRRRVDINNGLIPINMPDNEVEIIEQREEEEEIKLVISDDDDETNDSFEIPASGVVVKKEDIPEADDNATETKTSVAGGANDNNNNKPLNREEKNERLRCHFTNVVLTEPVKRQPIFLGPHDTEIAFDEERHIYFLPDIKKEFTMSATTFCKKEIHKSDFNLIEQLKKPPRSNVCDPDDYDMRVVNAVDWKYAALFGSMFHAVVEYFFNHIVNGCHHLECHNQPYNTTAYDNYLMEETNNYRLANGVCGQAAAPDSRFNLQPIMPCKYAIEEYEHFVTTITDDKTFAKFLANNQQYDITNAKYRDELTKTLDIVCSPEDDYRYTLEQLLRERYSMRNILGDLTNHLNRFGVILKHMPLGEFCDIRPEYIVFSAKHGLAGSVDLTMRSRGNPKLLYIYDWKTSRKIFRSFWRDGGQVNQLMDYSCQLHTYANLMRERYDNYNVELFVVNVNTDTSCIYNVSPHYVCKCRDIYEKLKSPMISLCSKYEF